jgi:hypothetical protein
MRGFAAVARGPEKFAGTGLRGRSLRHHDDFRANLYAIEEIDHVVIGEPNKRP